MSRHPRSIAIEHACASNARPAPLFCDAILSSPYQRRRRTLPSCDVAASAKASGAPFAPRATSTHAPPCVVAHTGWSRLSTEASMCVEGMRPRPACAPTITVDARIASNVRATSSRSLASVVLASTIPPFKRYRRSARKRRRPGPRLTSNRRCTAGMAGEKPASESAACIRAIGARVSGIRTNMPFAAGCAVRARWRPRSARTAGASPVSTELASATPETGKPGRSATMTKESGS